MFEKINSIASYVFIAIGVILMVVTMTDDYVIDETTKECIQCGAGAGLFISMGYILLILAVVAALGGAVFQAILNPKQIKGALIGIIGLAVIFGVSYVLADGTVEPYYSSDITETASKLSGMGLYGLYIIFVLAVLAIAYSSVARLLK